MSEPTGRKPPASARERLRNGEQRAAAAARDAVPALITGGAGDDPAGVVTYTIVGATTGFTQLWLLVLATPMLAAAERQCEHEVEAARGAGAQAETFTPAEHFGECIRRRRREHGQRQQDRG